MWVLVLIYLEKFSLDQDVSVLITKFFLYVLMEWVDGILMFT